MPSYNGGPYYSPKAEVTKIVDGSAVTGVQVEQENEGLRLNFTNEAGDEAFSAHIPAYSGSGSGVLSKNFAEEIESRQTAMTAHILDGNLHLTEEEKSKLDDLTSGEREDVSNCSTSVNTAYNYTKGTNTGTNVLTNPQKVSDGFSIINAVFKKVFEHMKSSDIHIPKTTLASYCTTAKYNTLKSTVDTDHTSLASLTTTVNGHSTAKVELKTSAGKALTWKVMWASKPVEREAGKSSYWTVCTTSIPFTGLAMDSYLPNCSDGYFFVSNGGGYINWFQESDKAKNFYQYPYTFKEKPIVTVSARCTTDLTASAYSSAITSGKELYWGLPVEAKMLADGTTLYLPSIVVGTYNKYPYTKRTSLKFDFVLDIMVQGWTGGT